MIRILLQGFNVRLIRQRLILCYRLFEIVFDGENQNFAFVNDEDEYLGTISLKHISHDNDKAEYAVVARKCAQGTGAAKKATEELLEYAFTELALHKVYLSVLEENIRAQKFYEKCGFIRGRTGSRCGKDKWHVS